ncbi:MAG TPA: rRNA maturation RNase YbeY [Candidatus Paceibacterota bacterium]
MKVEISHCVKKPVSDSAIRKAIGETLKLLNIKSEAVLSVALVGEKKMRSLNKVWRGKNSPTDVLSFSFLEDKPTTGKREMEEAGEVIICLPVAARQARFYGLSEKKHIARLVAHGTMHIFGLDHERSEKEHQIMEEVQKKIVKMI